MAATAFLPGLFLPWFCSHLPFSIAALMFGKWPLRTPHARVIRRRTQERPHIDVSPLKNCKSCGRRHLLAEMGSDGSLSSEFFHQLPDLSMAFSRLFPNRHRMICQLHVHPRPKLFPQSHKSNSGLVICQFESYTWGMPQLSCQSNCTVIELGECYDSLDLDALNEVGHMLMMHARTADPPRLILDMSQTTLVGSAFIELLVRTWRELVGRDGTLALCGLQPFCAEIVRATRLESLWDCFPTRDGALEAMDQG
jgi:anti-anti-sigma factor